MEETIRIADARAEPFLLIEGNPKYYERFGFSRADAVGLEPPPEARGPQYFMVRPLAAYDPAFRGHATYPPETFGIGYWRAVPTEARRTAARCGRGPARALSATRSRAARTAALRSCRRLYQCMGGSPSSSERRFLPLSYGPLNGGREPDTPGVH
jgi:hypothetical protein